MSRPTDNPPDGNTPDALNKSYGAPEMVEQRRRTLAALGLRTGDRILDVGCGTGFLTRELAAAVGESGTVIAIDHNEAMVEATALSCAPFPQVEAETGDVTSLVFSDAAFDAVTCTQVLLYVEDVAAAINQMCRVLKPGGRLAILETDWRTAVLHSPDPRATAAVFASWDESVASPNLPVHLGLMMNNAGIHVENVEAIPLLNTRYDIANFSASSLDWLSRIGVKGGVFDQAGAARWIEGIQHLGETGRYFFCVNRFLFAGLKPEYD